MIILVWPDQIYSWLKKALILYLYGIDIWDKNNQSRYIAQKNSSLSIAISNFTKKKLTLLYGKLKNIKVCWLSTIYDKIYFTKKKKKFHFFIPFKTWKGKGHNFTLNSFKKLNKKNVRLMIVGKGPEFKNIKKKITELNLKKK